MKISEFKKVIKEEVKKAIAEELSRLEQEEALNETAQPIQQAPPQTYAPKNVNTFGTNPLASMLEQTRSQMSGEDYRNVIGMDSSAVQKPNFASRGAHQMGMTSGDAPGIDLSQLDFVKNAKKVLDLANEKSRNKLT